LAVTAEIVVPDAGVNGVIVARGGVTGGRSLYAHEGKLVYMYNAFTGEVEWVELDIAMPPRATPISSPTNGGSTSPWAFSRARPATAALLPISAARRQRAVKALPLRGTTGSWPRRGRGQADVEPRLPLLGRFGRRLAQRRPRRK
jgi:hypothetical protein